jgi:hypothetical protein
MTMMAGWVPVSETLLRDVPGIPLRAFISQALTRKMTADMFGESWSSAALEQERLEMGTTVQWDGLVWDDEDWDW